MPRKKIKEPAKSPFHIKVEEIIGYRLQSEPLERGWDGGPKPGTPTVVKLKIDWTIGGMTGGSCWDDGETDNHRPVSADPEPELEELDKLLEVFCPTITFMQYKRLSQALIKRDTYTDYEYYGNYYEKAVKFVVLSDLEQYLKDNGLWTEK